MVLEQKSPARRWLKRSTIAWLAILLGIVLAAGFLVFRARAKPPIVPVTNNVTNPIPSMAYYYIWFDSNSWGRAKVDYPSLGRYTSDDRAVMRQHIQWAKAAGLKAFIVSWKSTDVLNRRLDQLAQVAEEEDFKLAVIYEGLDFNRNPLPAAQVANDLNYFIKQFSSRKAFQIYSKPMVIWSGTWKYTPEEISQVTQPLRNSLLILASERNVKGYERLSGMVDGDAYYWSSVNPDTFTNYQDKLNTMAETVHQDGGLWIPPAAPGFDARQIGGTSTVDRKNGDTFKTQLNTAMAASPDAIGVISWNEFSENSYIEPSEKYGAQYLDILSQFDHAPLPNIGSFDSSESDNNPPIGWTPSKAIALGGLTTLILVGLVIVARRRSASVLPDEVGKETPEGPSDPAP